MFSKELFGQRLYEIRKKNHETQTDLGAVLGIAKSRVSEIESGKKDVYKRQDDVRPCLGDVQGVPEPLGIVPHHRVVAVSYTHLVRPWRHRR